MLTGGFPLTPFPTWFYMIGGGYLLGLPVPALTLIAAFAMIHVLMNYTAFGRAVYATGGNRRRPASAASTWDGCACWCLRSPACWRRSAGSCWPLALCPAPRPWARAGSWTSSRRSSSGYQLYRGRGTVWGTLVGVVFIGVIVNGMTLLNVPPTRSTWCAAADLRRRACQPRAAHAVTGARGGGVMDLWEERRACR